MGKASEYCPGQKVSNEASIFPLKYIIPMGKVSVYCPGQKVSNQASLFPLKVKNKLVRQEYVPKKEIKHWTHSFTIV